MKKTRVIEVLRLIQNGEIDRQDNEALEALEIAIDKIEELKVPDDTLLGE